ncbi:MAG TPA: E2 ligase fold family C protein [Pyrinomonadaceae bacterium]|jgi:molybdopterin/thiamine biosynthesis adenylyltransferase
MALANFFDKAAMAASQVLSGIDHSSFATALGAHNIGLAFDDSAAESREGRYALELSINLLARLYPSISIIPQGLRAEAAVEGLVTVAKAINPEIEIGAHASRATLFLALGVSVITSASPVIYVGSDGWVARVSTKGPVGSGSTDNPFGACAAACFGTANIFRVAFDAYLPAGVPDEELTLSLLDYDPKAAEPANLTLTPVDLGESYLVGLGAIGSAAVWALTRTPGLSGVLHLVDGEVVDLSNLQRYVLTAQKSVNEAKVVIAADQFRGTGIKARAHHERWGDFLGGVSRWNFERVAVAVDSDGDRIAVQASLPRWVINSWTQPGDLGVSRHGFLGEDACLMCLYLPEGEGQHLDKVIAEAIGLPEAFMEIRTMLHLNQPVGRSLLERAAAAMGVELEPLLRFENESVRSFYTQAVCGGVVLSLGGSLGGASKHQMAAAPLAFQSALAGVMLAAELVIHAGRLRPHPLPVTTKVNLLRPLASHLSIPARKHPSCRCICQDEDYKKAYVDKYGATAGQSNP